MNWEQIQGNWRPVKVKMKEKWGRLTDDDLDLIAGERDQLIGMLQERYGIPKGEADRQIREFERAYYEEPPGGLRKIA